MSPRRRGAQRDDREKAFELKWEVAAEVEAIPVPPLLVLPLAENAVKHGPAAGHRGTIALEARLDGQRLRLTLENPGASTGPRAGSSGLPTVQRRLALAYGGKASLTVQASSADRTRAELSLPQAGPSSGVSV